MLRMKLAALYVGAHPVTLKRAMRDGKLKVAGRCGRSWTFRRADLDAWLLGQSAPVGEVARHATVEPHTEESRPVGTAEVDIEQRAAERDAELRRARSKEGGV